MTHQVLQDTTRQVAGFHCRGIVAIAASLFLAACGPVGDAVTEPVMSPRTALSSQPIHAIPSRGAPLDLDVATWTLEWFGDPNLGPSDDALQLSNARDVMAGADQDVWGVQEVVDTTDFRQLVQALPGYAGVVASDAMVIGGSANYSASEQKVALVYRTSVATLVGARVILAANQTEFAGRPPVEYRLRVSLNGATEELVFIVLHAKAFADAESWSRRQAASVLLKDYIDTTWPTAPVFVVGDLNDDLDTSILAGSPTPYANFLSDAARYLAPTKSLSDAGIASTVSYPDIIDHQIVTDELAARYRAGSAAVYRVDAYIPSYGTSTTDHFPVLTRFAIGGTTPNVAPQASFTPSCRLLVCTFTDASTDADGSVVAWRWDFGDGTTSTVRSPSKTYAIGGSYTVRLTATDNSGATGLTTRTVTVAPSTKLAGRVIINEILANEPGSTTAGEAIELVNVGGTKVTIAGWTLSDGSAVRHTFAARTELLPGKSITVFAGASAIPSGIVTVAASTGQLNLANTGDQVILRSGTKIIDQVSYGADLAGADGVSMNRFPDLVPGSPFVLHSAISPLPSSLGLRSTGLPY